jgi:hypothetical protein
MKKILKLKNNLNNLNNFNISLICILSIIILLLTYSISDFIIDIFGDRDLVRADNLFSSFETFGADFGMQGGRRIPGGFNYYYINFLFLFSKNILIINYISYLFSVLSIWFLAKKNFEHLNLSGFLITIIIFLSSDTFVYQAKKFWNPSLGLPFITISLIFFYNFLKSFSLKNLFFFFLFSFLATQFHISFISIPILGLIFFIIYFREYWLKIIVIFFIAILISYLPLIIDLLFNTFSNYENDYEIIKNNHHKFQLGFFKFLQNEIFSRFFNLNLDLSFFEILIISSLLVLSAFTLFAFQRKIIMLIKSKFELLIFFSLVFLLIITSLFAKNLGIYKFSFFLIFFILSTISYAILVINKNQIFIDDLTIKIINFKTLIFLSIILLSSIGYIISYSSVNIIIGDSSRYSLVILPLYALLIGYFLSIILSWSKPKKKLNFLIQALIIILLLVKLFIFYNTAINNSKNHLEYNYLNKKNIIEILNNEFELSKKDFLNNVSFYIYKNKKIKNLSKPSFEYFINNFVEDYEYKSNKCYLVIINTFSNDYKNENFTKLLRELNSLDYLANTFKDDFNDHYKFENFFIVRSEPNLAGGCPKGLLNDYIISKKEKETYNFLNKKESNKFYKTKLGNTFKYYLKILEKNMNYPLNILFEIIKIENEINIILHSKSLRNSDTFLNGFWDETHLLNPKLIFKDYSNNKTIKLDLVDGKLGEYNMKTPWSISINDFHNGEYSVFFEFDKIQQMYNKQLKINKKIFLLEKSFIYKK